MTSKTIAISDSYLFSLELVVPVLSFAIPFFISGPQLLTGTIVNTLLFLAAAKTSKKVAITSALLPSVGALLNGIVFGKFTPFLFYFLPFIWIGNLILINIFKRMSYSLFSMLTSAFTKSLFLFIFAFIFFKLSIVPQIFLTAMGIFQFATAILGGSLYLLLDRMIPYERHRQTH